MVILMKTYGKLIIGAILIGSFLAFLFYRDIKNEVNALSKENSKAYLFQVGVFTSEANAINYAEKFASHALVNIDKYYRVLICTTTSIENKEKLYDYYQKQNINFYIKEMAIDQDLNEKLSYVDQLLQKTNENKVINKLCQDQLQTFVTYSS